MLALPQWVHELATLATLGLAGGWLVAQWLRVASVGPVERGCARCDHNPVPQPKQTPAIGRRSKHLRVL